MPGTDLFGQNVDRPVSPGATPLDPVVTIFDVPLGDKFNLERTSTNPDQALTIEWDGADATGAFVNPGEYEMVTAATAAGDCGVFLHPDAFPAVPTVGEDILVPFYPDLSAEFPPHLIQDPITLTTNRDGDVEFLYVAPGGTETSTCAVALTVRARLTATADFATHTFTVPVEQAALARGDYLAHPGSWPHNQARWTGDGRTLHQRTVGLAEHALPFPLVARVFQLDSDGVPNAPVDRTQAICDQFVTKSPKIPGI